MASVTKSNSKFTLLPDPTLAALTKSSQDKTALEKAMSQSEIYNLLLRILFRLEALEQQ